MGRRSRPAVDRPRGDPPLTLPPAPSESIRANRRDSNSPPTSRGGRVPRDEDRRYTENPATRTCESSTTARTRPHTNENVCDGYAHLANRSSDCIATGELSPRCVNSQNSSRPAGILGTEQARFNVVKHITPYDCGEPPPRLFGARNSVRRASNSKTKDWHQALI